MANTEAGILSGLSNITDPYGALEAFVYDFFVAPGVLDIAVEQIEAELGSIPDGARVLDVGCGGGQMARALAQRRPDLHVTGIDLSADQVRRARRRAGDIADRVEFVQGSALDLPFPDADFDAVYSIASIKHWPDPAAGLAECARVLRPGGQLLVAEADRGCRYEDAAAFVARMRLPALLRVPSLAAFRTFVAGQSLDADDLRALAEKLALREFTVERQPGLPSIALRGVR